MKTNRLFGILGVILKQPVCVLFLVCVLPFIYYRFPLGC